MNGNGYITSTVHRGPMGNDSITFGWEGGPVVAISDRVLSRANAYVRRLGDVITVGPYRLRILDRRPDIGAGAYLCVRDGWKARLYQVAFSTVRWLDPIYRRLILTLAVWGLARFGECTMPNWQDVYALDALARAMGNAQRRVRDRRAH